MLVIASGEVPSEAAGELHDVIIAAAVAERIASRGLMSKAAGELLSE